MKILASLLALTTIGFAIICYVQYDTMTGLRRQLAVVRADADQKSREIIELETTRKQSEQQHQELQRQADNLTIQLQARQAAELKLAAAVAAISTNRAAASIGGKPVHEGAGFGGMLSKMMQDPNMKKFIRDQQRTMMDQLYNPLIKQLGLSPEEAAKFKDLLADNMMTSAEKATSLMGGLSATNRSEWAATLTADQKTFQDQVKAFLGDARYAQYEDYQQTVGERTQLNMFKQQGGAGDNPLNDQQTDQLLAIMKEEKQKAATELGQSFAGAGQDQAKLEAMFSEEQADKLFQSQEAVNQRVFERARAVLSTDQLEAFGKFQTNQLQMMRMGIGMARKMFAPEPPDQK